MFFFFFFFFQCVSFYSLNQDVVCSFRYAGLGVLCSSISLFLSLSFYFLLFWHCLVSAVCPVSHPAGFIAHLSLSSLSGLSIKSLVFAEPHPETSQLPSSIVLTTTPTSGDSPAFFFSSGSTLYGVLPAKLTRLETGGLSGSPFLGLLCLSACFDAINYGTKWQPV